MWNCGAVSLVRLRSMHMWICADIQETLQPCYPARIIKLRHESTVSRAIRGPILARLPGLFGNSMLT